MSMPSQLARLADHDPEMHDLIEREKARQFFGLEMIASENLTSRAAMECMGSALCNKYAEGEVGAKYYGGTEYVEQIEALAKKRALGVFKLNDNEWGVNVQPYSGSPANFEVFTGLLKPHDRIMGLGLTCGGHLTHGFYTPKKRISASAIYFESLPYGVDDNGLIDYAGLEKQAELFRPNMIILGASAYSRDYDYERVRKLCDNIGCYLMMDMAHSAGLIAAGLLKTPFDYADVVTTTTHKTLRGTRGGLIFFRKTGRDGKPTDMADKINNAVFPTLQGGPHMVQIAGFATQFKEVASPEWVGYAKDVVDDSRELARLLTESGNSVVTGGTDNHMFVWDLRSHGISGSKYEKVLELVGISVNKNTIPGDKSAGNPSGVRIGLSALASRGFKPGDMVQVHKFLMHAVELTQKIQKECGSKLLKDFIPAMQKSADIKAMRKEVEAYAGQFPMPGFTREELKYKDGVPE